MGGKGTESGLPGQTMPLLIRTAMPLFRGNSRLANSACREMPSPSNSSRNYVSLLDPELLSPRYFQRNSLNRISCPSVSLCHCKPHRARLFQKCQICACKSRADSPKSRPFSPKPVPRIAPSGTHPAYTWPLTRCAQLIHK